MTKRMITLALLLAATGLVACEEKEYECPEGTAWSDLDKDGYHDGITECQREGVIGKASDSGSPLSKALPGHDLHAFLVDQSLLF